MRVRQALAGETNHIFPEAIRQAPMASSFEEPIKTRRAVVGGANHIFLEGIRQVALAACQVSACISHPGEWLRVVTDTSIDLAIVDATEKAWDIGILLDRLEGKSENVSVIALIPVARLYEYSSLFTRTRRCTEFLPASVSADTLLGTIKRVLQDRGRNHTLPPSALVESLTDRQRNILLLLCTGESTKSVGGLLNISTRTVEFHKYRMMKALGVTSTTQLVLFGVEAGLGSPVSRIALPGISRHTH